MDKKEHLKRLMVAGIASGIFISSPLISLEGVTQPKTLMALAAENDGNTTYHLMTEDELLLQLNPEGTKIYNSLTPEGKALARETASRSCNGTNTCSGLNACASSKNKCAGKGTCKGTSKCAISDPNLAVKLAAKKMAEKRTEAQNPTSKDKTDETPSKESSE